MKIEPLSARSHLVTALEGVILGELLAIFALLAVRVFYGA